MTSLPLLRVVIDTNVVFEGLTKKGGASGLIIDAWLAGLMVVCVLNTLAYEYDDVLSRKLAPEPELSSDMVARLQERIRRRA